MHNYAHFYYFYNSITIKLIRLLVLVSLILGIVYFYTYRVPLNTLVFSLLWFLQIEIFVAYHIARKKPNSILSNSGKNMYDACTLPALRYLLSYAPTIKGLGKYTKYESVQFLLAKSTISPKELPVTEIKKDELLHKALELAQKLNGVHITSVDLAASYILLLEPTSKLLFNKNVKEEEFMDILKWARYEYKEEEQPPSRLIRFEGQGIGVSWTTGWTIETRKYMQEVGYSVLSKNPMVVGRDSEYKKAIEVLSRKETNNVLLVGAPGSGKTSLVETLAYESYLGKLPQGVNYSRFYQLMVGTLLAGATNQGELDNRMQAVLEEIKYANNVIIYIADLENILGASTFHIDLSGSLLPYFRHGSIRIIATITPENYKKYIESKPGIKDVMEVIRFEEPDLATGIKMLLEKAGDIEKKYGVSISYKAVKAAGEFAHRYIQDNVLPGSAVTLLEDAANSISLAKGSYVDEKDIVKTVEAKTNINIAAPNTEEKGLLLNFEKEMHKRVVGQDEAVDVISEAVRRYRSGVTQQNKPMSFLFLGPTGVGKTETAKALASIYYHGEEHMIRVDMSEYATEEGQKRLLGALPGEQTVGSGSQFIEEVQQHPASLILLDEFEKAHPGILDVFLQVLDDGRLTSNSGKSISLDNSLIIATSNAGSEYIRQEITKGTVIDKAFYKNLLDLLQSQHLFKPELLNRFDQIVVFKPLAKEQIAVIAQMMLKSITKTMEEKDITVTFSQKSLEKIVNEGYEIEFGARPLRRYIQDNIEDILSKKLLSDEIKRGSKIEISTDSSGAFVINNV